MAQIWKIQYDFKRHNEKKYILSIGTQILDKKVMEEQSASKHHEDTKHPFFSHKINFPTRYFLKEESKSYYIRMKENNYKENDYLDP